MSRSRLLRSSFYKPWEQVACFSTVTQWYAHDPYVVAHLDKVLKTKSGFFVNPRSFIPQLDGCLETHRQGFKGSGYEQVG